jgi:hypothetical protein
MQCVGIMENISEPTANAQFLDVVTEIRRVRTFYDSMQAFWSTHITSE